MCRGGASRGGGVISGYSMTQSELLIGVKELKSGEERIDLNTLRIQGDEIQGIWKAQGSYIGLGMSNTKIISTGREFPAGGTGTASITVGRTTDKAIQFIETRRRTRASTGEVTTTSKEIWIPKSTVVQVNARNYLFKSGTSNLTRGFTDLESLSDVLKK